MLEVEDHGVGFGQQKERRGMGLTSMRERAELVHGTIEFLEHSGGGALVRLTVPDAEKTMPNEAFPCFWWTITAWCGAVSGACWKTIRRSKSWARRATDMKRWSWRTALEPRVVVMDFALPSMNGAVATRQILQGRPGHGGADAEHAFEPTYVRTCLDAGARGYLLKNAVDLELVDAVKQVAAGVEVLDPRLGDAPEDSEGARR